MSRRDDAPVCFHPSRETETLAVRIVGPRRKSYWIVNYPPHPGPDTGLRDEPTLSHPHNIFLHVWVSMGIFGLLAFIVVLVLFVRLFFRVLAHVQSLMGNERVQLSWMVIGVGAAMVAAMVQGQGDSAFLEQDLAFCFWMLVTALLLLREITATPWRGQLPIDQKTTQKIQ